MASPKRPPITATFDIFRTPSVHSLPVDAAHQLHCYALECT